MSKSLIFVLLCALLPSVMSQFNTDDCSVTKFCFMSITNCNVSNPDCTFFSWVLDETTQTFFMEMSGGSGNGDTYNGIAFSESRRMVDADLYICTGGELKSGAIRLQNAPPFVGSILPPEITEPTAETVNGVAQCTFRRAVNVSKEISNREIEDFNLLSRPFFLLQAQGFYIDNAIQYHLLNRWTSDEAIDFGRSLPIEPPEPPEPSQSTISSTSVSPTPGGSEFPAPENLLSDATSNAIAVFWEAVEGALQYYVTLSDGQSLLTSELRAAFGGLEPNTVYTATVAAANASGTASSRTSSIEILTLAHRIQDLRSLSVEATETSLRAQWEPLEGATSYRVSITNDTDHKIEANVTIVGTSALISGLEPNTFYYIMVTGLVNETVRAMGTIRARTEGSGVIVGALWNGFQGAIGGEASILRPITIPDGPYSIQLNFGCSLQSVRVWNADLDEEASSLLNGSVVFTQSAIWQLQKSEIGMNFYYAFESDNTARCLTNGTIPADFGIQLQGPPKEEPATSRIVPVHIHEWQSHSTNFMQAAGVLEIRLLDVFNSTQPPQVNLTSPKPARGKFIIALNSGPGCEGGIMVLHGWGLTQKSAADIEDANPSLLYFVQQGDDWYTNRPGFVYGYNPIVCGNRTGIFADVITGSPIVQDIINAPSIMMQD